MAENSKNSILETFLRPQPVDSPVRQIFLSYSRSDQDQVEQIAIRLDRAGYRVWFDRVKLIPGDSWSDQLDQALRESSHCLVCISQGAARPWQREEVRTAINRAVTDVSGFRLIPILLPDAAGHRACRQLHRGVG